MRVFDDPVQRLLSAMAEEQAHVVSRRQLLALGVGEAATRSRLRAGLWQRGYPGTYVTHNGDLSYQARVWSAVLYAGDGCLASHETAGYLNRLVDVAPDRIHLTVPATRRVKRQSGLIVHLTRRPVVARVGWGPPCTSVEETVLDLISSSTTADEVIGFLTKACQRRLTAPTRLLAASRLRNKMPWRALIEDVAAAVAEGIESVLEWRYLRDVERRHRLPPPSRQLVVVGASGRPRRDAEYDDYCLVVELDGAAFHGGDQIERDGVRDNTAAAQDWLTLRYGWRDVAVLPCATAAQVATVLQNRGWSGDMKRCRTCDG